MMNPTPSAFLNAFTAGLLLGGVAGGLLATFYWTKLICGYLVREDEQVTEILGRGGGMPGMRAGVSGQGVVLPEVRGG